MDFLKIAEKILPYIIIVSIAIAGWEYVSYNRNKVKEIEKERKIHKQKIQKTTEKYTELKKKDSIRTIRYNRKVDSIENQLNKIIYTLRKHHKNYENTKNILDSINTHSDISKLPILSE